MLATTSQSHRDQGKTHSLYQNQPTYLPANQQLEGVVNSRAFMKQQRLKLHLLHVIKCIKHNGEELGGEYEKKSY